MSSRTELGAFAAVALLALGCPEPGESVLIPLPAMPDAATELQVPDASVAPARAETLDAVVFEFTGTAEVRRAGSGEWVALAVGDAVRVTDEVRTSAEGQLEMRFGEARVRVHEGSELTLNFLDARAIRANVKGLASGSAPDGGELSLEGGGSVLVTNGGQLSLEAKDGKAIATSSSGGARLTSGGKTVDVAAGAMATSDGSAPARPGRLPKKVTLSVKWPARLETNQPTLVVKGQASAFARVLVGGSRVETAADGAFEAKVALKRGVQSLSVVAVDPLGKRKVETRKITFDPNAPTVRGKVEYR